MALDISRIPQFQLEWFTEIETIWNEIEAVANDSSSRLDKLEAQPRTVKVDYYDPVSSVLPTGPSVTIDGNLGQNGDIVLFGNLSSGNLRAYQLSGVGSSIVWTPLELFGNDSASETPFEGDRARILKGDFFADQVAVFDGTDWKINDLIRLFNGADFWEMSSLQTTDIMNNSSGIVFSVAAAGSEHIEVHYSISRGSTHETGMLVLTTDATSEVAIAEAFASPSSTGVGFSGQINGSDLELSYNADNAGPNGTMKYYIVRWSNSAGGPAGIPSYSQAGGSTVAASGNAGDLQFNSGGNLAADSRFQWDSGLGALDLNDFEFFALSPNQTILDAQGSPASLITYDASDYPTAFIDYSIDRNGQLQAGTLIVVNNGASTGIANNFASTTGGDIGVDFSASLSAGNVIISYESDAVGSAGTLRYQMRRWPSS